MNEMYQELTIIFWKGVLEYKWSSRSLVLATKQYWQCVLGSKTAGRVYEPSGMINKLNTPGATVKGLKGERKGLA